MHALVEWLAGLVLAELLLVAAWRWRNELKGGSRHSRLKLWENLLHEVHFLLLVNVVGGSDLVGDEVGLIVLRTLHLGNA